MMPVRSDRKRPKVSLIVTTFNVEPYIERCINSIMAQSYKDFELIIVDDASTDQTLSKLERSVRFEKGLRKRVIPLAVNTPGGVGIPANIGVAAAEGEYIFFVDGDDWCEPDMLRKVVSLADSVKSDLVITGFQNYDDKNKRLETPKDAGLLAVLSSEHIDSPLDASRRARILRLNAVPWRKLYRRDFLTAHGISFPEGNFFFEDNPYHWFNVIKAERIAFLNEVVCYHRVNRPGQTVSAVGHELLWFYDHYDTIKRWLTTENLYEHYSVHLLGWIIGQSEWVVSKLLPELWVELFWRLREVLEPFSEEQLVRALALKGSGQLGWGLVQTVAQNNLFEFAKTIRMREDTTSSRVSKLTSQLDEMSKYVGPGGKIATELEVVKKQVIGIASRIDQRDEILSKAALMKIAARQVSKQ